MSSFWDKRTPCWKLMNCPEENRKQCGAYLAQHYPCWELPLEKRCPVISQTGSCEDCKVYLEYSSELQSDSTEETEQRSVNVLIVDDELLIRWSLYQTLRREGYNVDIAADGEEALEKMEGASYQYIMVDYKMPGMDGLTLAEIINARSPQSRVILMTAYGSEETEKRARDLGLIYLTKQMDLERISEYLR